MKWLDVLIESQVLSLEVSLLGLQGQRNCLKMAHGAFWPFHILKPKQRKSSRCGERTEWKSVHIIIRRDQRKAMEAQKRKVLHRFRLFSLWEKVNAPRTLTRGRPPNDKTAWIWKVVRCFVCIWCIYDLWKAIYVLTVSLSSNTVKVNMLAAVTTYYTSYSCPALENCGEFQ